MAKKKTHEEFVQEVKKLSNNEYEVLETYKGSNYKILLKHNKCNNEWRILPYNFLKGQRCPYCANKKKSYIPRPKTNKKKTTKQFKQEVSNLVGVEYEVLGEYINNKTKLLMKHNKCSNEYYVTPHDFLMKKGNCPYCAGHKKKTKNEFIQEVHNLTNNEYEVLGEYINARTKTLIKHNKCGHEYYIRPNEFIQGNRCPYCAHSKGEEFIENYLKENNIPYETQVSFEDCKNINILKFDFKIYLKDASFILLEYNGIQHYKNSFGDQKNFKLQQKRDQIKKEYCKKNKINLEIISYKDNIKQRLEEITKR